MNATTTADPRIAKLDRLPPNASEYQQKCLLVNWHIARDMSDAAKLLAARRNLRKQANENAHKAAVERKATANSAVPIQLNLLQVA